MKHTDSQDLVLTETQPRQDEEQREQRPCLFLHGSVIGTGGKLHPHRLVNTRQIHSRPLLRSFPPASGHLNAQGEHDSLLFGSNIRTRTWFFSLLSVYRSFVRFYVKNTWVRRRVRRAQSGQLQNYSYYSVPFVKN